MAGEGTRENREREGYGRREKKGREAGSLRWAGSRIEIQKGKLSLFVLIIQSKKRTQQQPPPLPPPHPPNMKSGQCQDCKPHFYFFRLLVRWLLLYFLLCYFFPFASPFFKYNLHVFLSIVRFKVFFKKTIRKNSRRFIFAFIRKILKNLRN